MLDSVFTIKKNTHLLLEQLLIPTYVVGQNEIQVSLS